LTKPITPEYNRLMEYKKQIPSCLGQTDNWNKTNPTEWCVFPLWNSSDISQLTELAGR
jgi:hypothetical protein